MNGDYPAIFDDYSCTKDWNMEYQGAELHTYEDWDCYCISQTLNIFYLDSDLKAQQIVYILMVLSIVCNALIVIFIYCIPGIQEHPMKIIMWIAASSFSYMWLSLIAPFSCDLGLNKLYEITAPGFFIGKSSMTFIYVKNTFFWKTYFEGLTILLNIVLSVDLLMTLR